MEKEEAKRNEIQARYDILDPLFLDTMAKIAWYGAKTYGEFNWQISRLTGNKSPINHIYKHLMAYRMCTQYDHEELGSQRYWHLAAIAFNAMMEFYYETSFIEPALMKTVCMEPKEAQKAVKKK